MDRDVIAGDDGIVAGQEGGDDGMRCPVCGNVNLGGADICDNCGADIFGHDTPLQAPAFKGQLLGEHLDELGSPPPITVDADTPIDVAIARMHEAGADCVLVVADDRLLLTQLAARTGAGGRWNLPGGGLDPGEGPEDAVVREVLEETGQVKECGVDARCSVDGRGQVYRRGGSSLVMCRANGCTGRKAE